MIQTPDDFAVFAANDIAPAEKWLTRLKRMFTVVIFLRIGQTACFTTERIIKHLSHYKKCSGKTQVQALLKTILQKAVPLVDTGKTHLTFQVVKVKNTSGNLFSINIISTVREMFLLTVVCARH